MKMSLKLFHTSDIHLGLKFANYPPDKQSELCKARFKTLENLVNTANQDNCDIFTIGGDLFDRVGIGKRDVLRAVQILNKFSGKLMLILPGNHDYYVDDQTGLWSHFVENAGDNILLLNECIPYDLRHYDINACIYPAPCDKKHSNENHIEWIQKTKKNDDIKYHIGLAHGSLANVSPDFDENYFPMKQQQLLKTELDLWLLGHTHISYPINPGAKDKIFFPGTPEPDGFDCKHSGSAWVFEINNNKEVDVTRINTGMFRFEEDEISVNNKNDIDKLKVKYEDGLTDRLLVKLSLNGKLAKEDYAFIPQLRAHIEKEVFFLKWKCDITEAITSNIINKEFTHGSFPHQLLTTFVNNKDDEALQMAYEIINEVKE